MGGAWVTREIYARGQRSPGEGPPPAPPTPNVHLHLWKKVQEKFKKSTEKYLQFRFWERFARCSVIQFYNSFVSFLSGRSRLCLFFGYLWTKRLLFRVDEGVSSGVVLQPQGDGRDNQADRHGRRRVRPAPAGDTHARGGRRGQGDPKRPPQPQGNRPEPGSDQAGQLAGSGAVRGLRSRQRRRVPGRAQAAGGRPFGLEKVGRAAGRQEGGEPRGSAPVEDGGVRVSEAGERRAPGRGRRRARRGRGGAGGTEAQGCGGRVPARRAGREVCGVGVRGCRPRGGD